MAKDDKEKEGDEDEEDEERINSIKSNPKVLKKVEPHTKKRIIHQSAMQRLNLVLYKGKAKQPLFQKSTTTQASTSTLAAKPTPAAKPTLAAKSTAVSKHTVAPKPTVAPKCSVIFIDDHKKRK
ncbi:hypothetical protein BDR04DRAFT_1117518 [Suillus decipiens]|nr:hypothetical protein BDR04DRAFT_1117518 [Suillus decipiens]